MKTDTYNPSKLEVELAQVIAHSKDVIEAGLSANKIVDITASINQDNPAVNIKTQDKDGDPHEVVIQIIQRPDKF